MYIAWALDLSLGKFSSFCGNNVFNFMKISNKGLKMIFTSSTLSSPWMGLSRQPNLLRACCTFFTFLLACLLLWNKQGCYNLKLSLRTSCEIVNFIQTHIIDSRKHENRCGLNPIYTQCVSVSVQNFTSGRQTNYDNSCAALSVVLCPSVILV